jgi:hypothetical protein
MFGQQDSRVVAQVGGHFTGDSGLVRREGVSEDGVTLAELRFQFL